MKAQRFHFVLVIAALATAIIALVVPTQRNATVEDVEAGEHRIENVEQAIESNLQPAFSRFKTLDGKEWIFIRALQDSDEEWAARCARILRGEEPAAHYICTTLSGCDAPVSQIEVCTPCNSEPPSAMCLSIHASSVAAFCAEFRCTDCDGR